MATYEYRNRGTNQVVYVEGPVFTGNPLWELIAAPASDTPDGVGVELTAHETATTAVHGIANTALLETKAGAQGKADQAAALSIPLTDKGIANGVATLGSDAKIPSAQVPAFALSEFLGAAANQSAMLALTGSVGDWTIRSDLGTSWFITGSDPSQLGNWHELSYPPSPVTSVAGKVGAVALAGTDIASGTVGYARLPVGTTVNTIVAGDDSRIVNAASTTQLASGLAGKVAKGDLIFDIRDYGATTASASNNVEIQAAIDAAATAGGRVYIPSGTFLITPAVTGAGLLFKPGLRGITGNGTSSVLKVIDSMPGGEYYAILGDYNGTTRNDVGGLVLENFTIDQNNTHNQWTTSLTQYTIKPRFCVYISNATSPVAVRGMTFLDLDNTNTISIAGQVRDHEISGCRFSWGSCPNDHDASVLYTQPSGLQHAASWIVNNSFRSPGVASPSARTAIETHGGAQVIRGNVIDAFSKGINLTGVALWGGEGSVCEANIITNTRVGIMLWSRPFSTNTTDGLRHVIVRNNVIKLNGAGWAPVFAGAPYANGILRDNGAGTLPFLDVLIEGNSIQYDLTGYVGQSGDSVGNGIEWRDSALATTDKRIQIRNNRIDSAPAAGIRWSAIGDAIDISSNTIRNPGQGSVAAGGAMSNGSANGLMINGALTNSFVNGNHVIDDQGTPTTSVGVYLFPTADGSSNNRAVDNRVPVATSKKIETVTASHPGGWYIDMVHETYVAVTGQAAAGSKILDRSTGTVRTQTTAPNGTAWSVAATAYNFGAFIASGYYIAPEGFRSSGAIAAANTEYAIPLWIAAPGTLVRIGVSVTVVTSVTAGTVIRLGIRADNGAGKPGALILDAGTVAGDAVANPEITISQAIATAGLYWLTATCQIAGATLPTVRMLGTGGMYPVSAGSIVNALSGGLCGYTATGVSGALPGTYTVANQVALSPLIAVRG